MVTIGQVLPGRGNQVICPAQSLSFDEIGVKPEAVDNQAKVLPWHSRCKNRRMVPARLLRHVRPRMLISGIV